MRKLTIALTLMALALVTGCVNRMKAGDQAAAMGNWKAAYANYALAVQKDPNDPALKQKLEEARVGAHNQAMQQGNAFIQQGNFEGAVKEAVYAEGLKHDLAAATNLKLQAYRGWAASDLDLAQTAVARQDYQAALTHVEQAKTHAAAASDPGLQSRVDGMQRQISNQATQRVRQLQRQAKQRGADTPTLLNEALAILDALARAGAPNEALANQVGADYDNWRRREVQRLQAVGQRAAQKRQWQQAADAWRQAAELSPEPRIQADLAFANAMVAGSTAASQGNYEAAAQAFRDAIATGRDSQGFAAEELELVEIRPYRFKLLSVLVRPVRPDGRPWSGPKNKNLGKIRWKGVGRIYSHGGRVRQGQRGRNQPDHRRETGRIQARNQKSIRRVPQANVPNVKVYVTLPDGRQLATDTRKGIYTSYDASFVMMTNYYDQSSVTVRVVHVEGNGTETDIGAVILPIQGLLYGDPIETPQSLMALELYVEPSKPAQAGSVTGLTPLASAPAQPSPQPTPQPTPGQGGVTTIQILEAKLQVHRTEPAREPGDGLPDLQLQVMMNGRTLYQSDVVQDRWSATWKPQTQLNFRGTGPVYFRLVDVDPDDEDDVLIEVEATQEDLSGRTSNRWQTEKGTVFTVTSRVLTASR
jgi:hypothetical protein